MLLTNSTFASPSKRNDVDPTSDWPITKTFTTLPEFDSVWQSNAPKDDPLDQRQYKPFHPDVEQEEQRKFLEAAADLALSILRKGHRDLGFIKVDPLQEDGIEAEKLEQFSTGVEIEDGMLIEEEEEAEAEAKMRNDDKLDQVGKSSLESFSSPQQRQQLPRLNEVILHLQNFGGKRSANAKSTTVAEARQLIASLKADFAKGEREHLQGGLERTYAISAKEVCLVLDLGPSDCFHVERRHRHSYSTVVYRRGR